MRPSSIDRGAARTDPFLTDRDAAGRTRGFAVVKRLFSWLERDAEEAGQGLAEYALILALIAIVAIVALIFLGTQISTILSNTGHSI